MYNILFVCTGNTCRSSMAEGIFNDLIGKYKLEDKVVVKSAGISVFNGMPANTELGLSLAIIILIHNIPEGMSMAAPLSIAGVSKYKVILYTIYAGLPMGIGALIGAYIGNISDTFIGFSLGLAGGAMLYITCQEIIPKSNVLWKGRTSGVSIVFGIICGILLTQLLMQY